MPRSKRKQPKSFRAGRVIIGSSELHGQGVFAAEDIKEGEVVELCPYIVIDETDITEDTRLNDYLFTSPYTKKDFFVVLGYAMMYNHDNDGNIEWDVDEDDENFIIITATRDIKAGEELLQDYGKDYWESREDDD